MKTFKELEKEVQDINDKAPSWFCPQINDTCKRSCYCYVPAKLLIKSDSTPYIRQAYCSHILHQGEVFVNAMVQH